MSSPYESSSPAPSLLRVLRFPIIVLVVFGAIYAAPRVLVALDMGSEEAVPWFMLTGLSIPLAFLIIAVWWLFFSGVCWKTRLGGVVAVAVVIGGLGVGAIYAIRQVELTTTPFGLVPIFHFAWERSGQDRLIEFEMKEPAKSDDLKPIDASVGAEDFPAYRGRHRDGVVRFAKLQSDWVKYPPEKLWERPCGVGYSGFAVAGNIAVTLEQRKNQDTGKEHEVVVCYDRATGRKRWEHTSDTFYRDRMRMGNGPRSTPTIHDKHIFTIGATGQMLCLDADGTKKWSVNVLEDAKAKNMQWGLTGSPLIVDDLVIAHAGSGPDAPGDSALIAYEQTTGKKRWHTGNRKAGYSSPHLATLAGMRQILLFDAAGLIAYDTAGKELWSFPWVTMEDMNNIQPVVLGDDRVLISSEKDNGCALLRIKAPDNNATSWTVETVWHNKYLASRFANPVSDGKLIFGLNNLLGVITCLDAADGSVKWKGDRHGPGQLLLADNVLLVVNGDSGDVYLFDFAGTQLARHRTFTEPYKTWNTPALAGDQLFVRNQNEIVCLRLPR